MAKIGKLKISLLILLNVCAFSRPVQAETSIYVFGSDQSTVVKTGGFAGVHETYAVTGQFWLTVDSDAGVASFEIVDANLTGEDKSEYGRSLDEIFNMTGLAGTIIDEATIQFEGKTADGTESDVRLKLSFMEDVANITGKTTPPPNSADMFFYDIDAIAAKKYGGGTGEPNAPYRIYSAEHLNEMGAEPNDWGKNFKVMEDVDLAGYEYERAVIAPDIGGDGYTFPATAFTGVFDGNGHAVLNLTITGKSYLGLFGQVGPGGQVRDIGVVDVNITGSYYAIGGLVGDNLQGSITGSYSTGTVAGYTFVGGLVGYNNYGDISTSFSTCAVGASFSGNQNIGGLIGLNAGLITTSYSTGAVSGQRRVGGLVGRTTDLIAMCYSTGQVSGNEMVGGLVGVRDPNLGIVTDCFWDVQTSGKTTSAGGTRKTTAEMKDIQTFLDAGWDFETVWMMPAGDYPRLEWKEWETPDSGDWARLSSMKMARDQFAGGVIGDEIFVFGGNAIDGTNLYSGEKYDIATDRWSDIADNPHGWGVEEVSGIGLNGKFYVFGANGRYNDDGDHGVFNYNEMYDPTTDTWTTLAKKPTTTRASVPVVYEGKIYLFGGAGEDIDYTIVEAYDPEKDEWEYVTYMPKTLLNTAIAVHNDFAYLIAGYDYSKDQMSDEVMAYDFQKDMWIRNYCTASKDAAKAYSYATQTPVVNGKVYLIGGIEGESQAISWTSDKFIIFDIESKSWESGPALPGPIEGHLTVASGKTIYVIGGEDDVNTKDTVLWLHLPDSP